MQTRRWSMVEAVTNVAVGFVVSVLFQWAVFPIFGIRISFSENLAIATVFTVVSIARGYALRRIFNRIGR